jgi:hypothetical protein
MYGGFDAFGAVGGAVIGALLGGFARAVQEDLRRTRLRYYLRPVRLDQLSPDSHAAKLTVRNVGRSTAREILVYLSPRDPRLQASAKVIDVEVAKDVVGPPPTNEGHAAIVSIPALPPSDLFTVTLRWLSGAKEFPWRDRDCFRISYEFGTSNKLFRMFGRVHKFWWWQRCHQDRLDKLRQPDPSATGRSSSVMVRAISLNVVIHHDN